MTRCQSTDMYEVWPGVLTVERCDGTAVPGALHCPECSPENPEWSDS